ncbi:MAG: hypothetical protein DDT19_01046 [Syntrophomonadaceae bacterium]|nr:hypothetical protein [Bacillota bacterium]
MAFATGVVEKIKKIFKGINSNLPDLKNHRPGYNSTKDAHRKALESNNNYIMYNTLFDGTRVEDMTEKKWEEFYGGVGSVGIKMWNVEVLSKKEVMELLYSEPVFNVFNDGPTIRGISKISPKYEKKWTEGAYPLIFHPSIERDNEPKGGRSDLFEECFDYGKALWAKKIKDGFKGWEKYKLLKPFAEGKYNTPRHLFHLWIREVYLNDIHGPLTFEEENLIHQIFPWGITQTFDKLWNSIFLKGLETTKIKQIWQGVLPERPFTVPESATPYLDWKIKDMLDVFPPIYKLFKQKLTEIYYGVKLMVEAKECRVLLPKDFKADTLVLQKVAKEAEALNHLSAGLIKKVHNDYIYYAADKFFGWAYAMGFLRNMPLGTKDDKLDFLLGVIAAGNRLTDIGQKTIPDAEDFKMDSIKYYFFPLTVEKMDTYKIKTGEILKQANGLVKLADTEKEKAIVKAVASDIASARKETIGQMLRFLDLFYLKDSDIKEYSFLMDKETKSYDLVGRFNSYLKEMGIISGSDDKKPEQPSEKEKRLMDLFNWKERGRSSEILDKFGNAIKKAVFEHDFLTKGVKKNISYPDGFHEGGIQFERYEPIINKILNPRHADFITIAQKQVREDGYAGVFDDVAREAELELNELYKKFGRDFFKELTAAPVKIVVSLEALRDKEKRWWIPEKDNDKQIEELSRKYIYPVVDKEILEGLHDTPESVKAKEGIINAVQEMEKKYIAKHKGRSVGSAR